MCGRSRSSAFYQDFLQIRHDFIPKSACWLNLREG
jgi:hypothetical protein